MIHKYKTLHLTIGLWVGPVVGELFLSAVPIVFERIKLGGIGLFKRKN